MIYFAYGSNMLSYRLEKRVGKTEILGIGKLFQHCFAVNKLSKDGSLKADALFTGNPDDFVLGVLFRISSDSKTILDKEEGLGKGYESKSINVHLLRSNETVEAFCYYATARDDSGQNFPYDWYMRLIIAGAEEHKLDPGYVNKLKEIKCKEDDNLGRRDTSLFILKEKDLPSKSLAATFNLLHELNKSKQCLIHLPVHALNGRTIFIEKQGKTFQFQTDSKIKKGLQTHKELIVTGQKLVLEEKDTKWVIEGKNFLINNIEYDSDNLLKLLSGTINAIHSEQFTEKQPSYLRLIVPISERLKAQRDYQSSGFTVNYKLYGGLITIRIDGKTFHFYDIKFGENSFLVIDCLEPLEVKTFQKSCHCILMSYSFLSGPYNAGEGYFFTYNDMTFGKPDAILFHTMGDASNASMEVFTTNPYIGIDVDQLERDEKGEISEEQRKKLYADMRYFPADVFSNICQFAYDEEKILRAMTLLINNQSASLEMKIPIQYVTLETLTAAMVKGGNTELKPLKDEDAVELTSRLTKTIEQFAFEKAVNKDEWTPIFRKIEHLNSPPNADKLGKVFPTFGYALTEEEKKVLKERNKFLHGSIPSFGGMEDDFKELFHLSLRLHFLIAVLLLKKSGFSGRIINYAKLYSVITGKFLEEPVLKLV